MLISDKGQHRLRVCKRQKPHRQVDVAFVFNPNKMNYFGEGVFRYGTMGGRRSVLVPEHGGLLYAVHGGVSQSIPPSTDCVGAAL